MRAKKEKLKGNAAGKSVPVPGLFLIVADEPALVDTLPVLGQEFPVRAGFHRGMVLFAAYKAFHQAALLIDHAGGVLLCTHNEGISYPRHIYLRIGEEIDNTGADGTGICGGSEPTHEATLPVAALLAALIGAVVRTTVWK